jgi:hypothetical protein
VVFSVDRDRDLGRSAALGEVSGKREEEVK